MARTNRDQALTTSKDSLLRFNSDLANKYKAGVGLKYLDDFINAQTLENTLKDFLKNNLLEYTSTKAFETFLKSKTTKNLDWFFKDYISTNKKIDFKIKTVKKTDDSITLTIKNKRNNSMPISLFTLRNDTVTSKTWIENINNSKTITIPRHDINKLVLNYDNSIPEYNLRDNWKFMRVACVMAFVGIWVEKGMGLIVPGFIPTPLGDLVEYTPSKIEILVSLGIWAFGALIFTMMGKVVIAIETGELRFQTKENLG